LASVAPKDSPLAVAALPVEDAATLFARALSEREQGRTSNAIATFRALQRRFPQTPQAVLSLVSLADLSLGTGDAAGALVAFEEYLASGSSGALVPEALLGKARALSSLGRVAEADVVWREIARRYPDSPYLGRRIGTRTGSDQP
jgi:TolA-binding protein